MSLATIAWQCSSPSLNCLILQWNFAPPFCLFVEVEIPVLWQDELSLVRADLGADLNDLWIDLDPEENGVVLDVGAMVTNDVMRDKARIPGRNDTSHHWVTELTTEVGCIW